MNIFTKEEFEFPYDYHFPGQASDEFILFITRENAVMLWMRRLGVLALTLAIAFVINVADYLLSRYASQSLAQVFFIFGSLLALTILAVGWWWVTILWKKSIMMVTTQRLVKFIYTTPFNRHILSLPLDMIVDTGSYTKGYLQAIFKLGTFTARSSASSSGVATDDDSHRINKKYFYIENVAIAEDLQHYVNKLLQAFRHKRDLLPTFRPFLPYLKGDERKTFMENYPDFWS